MFWRTKDCKRPTGKLCQDCANERDKQNRKKINRAYYLRNKDAVNRQSAEWKRKNHDKAKRLARESAKRSYSRNPDFFRARAKQWRADNPEKAKEITRKRYPKVLAWIHDNWDRVKLQHQVRRWTERERGSVDPADWQAIKDVFGSKCLACGRLESELTERLNIDHVIPLSIGGMNDTSNVQPLCRSCNSKKRTKTIDYRAIRLREIMNRHISKNEAEALQNKAAAASRGIQRHLFSLLQTQEVPHG